MGFLSKVGGLVRSIKPSHEITSEIGEIKTSITILRERKETFGSILSDPDPAVESSSPGRKNSSGHDHKLDAYFIDEAQIVGIEFPKEELMRRLLDHNSKRTVVPVVGTGGLGRIGRQSATTRGQRSAVDGGSWGPESADLRLDTDQPRCSIDR